MDPPSKFETRVVEEPHAVSVIHKGRTLWTLCHNPAEGKPYFHPLASTDGLNFTDLRPDDHPWHRGVWFSWKFINGVNYWEESRETGKSDGETRLVGIGRKIVDNKVLVTFDIEYAPTGSDDVVLKERRTLDISLPDENGVYRIQWAGAFTAQDKDVVLDRTPLDGQPNGKSYGGYAGWSVRMNGEVRGGTFLNNHGQTQANRQPARWTLYRTPSGGSLLLMDHADNLNAPAKWYLAPGMPYFSPAVIHDAPHTIKAHDTLELRYVLVVHPHELHLEEAESMWQDWNAEE